MQKRITTILLFYFLSVLLSYAQNYNLLQESRADLIKTQLSMASLKTLDRIEKDENEGLKLMQISDQNYEELSKTGQKIDSEKDRKKRKELLKKSVKFETKAIKNRIQSLKIFNEAFINKFIILKADLKRHIEQADPITRDSALRLQDIACSHFESAELDVDRAYYTINQQDLFRIYTRAYQSERIGLLYLEKMYALLLNWNENLKSGIDLELTAFMTNRPAEQDLNEKFVVRIKDSVQIKTIIVYDTLQTVSKDLSLIYKVQIAASKKPISEDQLKRIYPENQLINLDMEDSWYKYSVGYFSNYIDAQNFKINSGVHDAFIVAWKNGKKISVQESFTDQISSQK